MEEQNSMYLTQEIICTNQELRKQLAEDDIIIDYYIKKIRNLEHDLVRCNHNIEFLSDTLVHSKDEINALKNEKCTISKQLQKALQDVDMKEEVLLLQDNRIIELESKILTLKNRIKAIVCKTMAQPVVNVQPTIVELDNVFHTIQTSTDVINNHFYPAPGRSPSRNSKNDILTHFSKISDNATRLLEVAKWYLVAQNQIQADANTINRITNEKDQAQQMTLNAQRRVNNLQTQVDTLTNEKNTAVRLRNNAIKQMKDQQDDFELLNTRLELAERRFNQANHDYQIENRKHMKWKDRGKTLRAKHAKWKGRFRTSHAKHAKWKQRFRLLEQQVNQIPNMATRATSIEAMQVIGPELAKIPNFIGQETPDDFIRKFSKILSPVWSWSTDGNVVAGDRANASVDPALHLNILKSKMGGQFAQVPDAIPADFPITANQAINSDVHFITWLNEKFKRETIGTTQSALSGLMQEKFTVFDTPDSYEIKVRPYLIGFGQNDPNIINILLGHLPDGLFNRMENVGPVTINAFFTTLKNLWMKRKPESSLAKNQQFTQFYHQPDQNIVPQPTQNIAPQPIQNIVPQPTYYKVDPKAFVEDTYGKGTWNLDSRASDTYNTTRDIIKRGQDIQAFNQGNNRDIDSIIERALQRRLELESNPKFEKINRYRNIIDTAQRGIENEENRPDDPMDIDYIIANLAKSNYGDKPKRTVNRTKGKSKKTKPKKKTKTKKKVRHIYVNGQEEVEESSSSEEGDSSSSEEGDSSDEEQYYVNSAKKKLM